MIITANGRSALMLAAGLLLGIAGPMRATPGHAQEAAAADTTETTETAAPSKPIELKKFSKPRHAKVATRAQRSAKVAAKAAKDADAEPAKDVSKDAASAPAIPDAFANANAQLPVDAPPETPQTVSTKADNVLKVMGGNPDADAAPQAAPAPDTTANVVPPDQLNELDRAATDDSKPTLTLASATIEAPAMVSNEDSSTLDKTSLIGKIFIACGGLLTLASAARMFIA